MCLCVCATSICLFFFKLIISLLLVRQLTHWQLIFSEGWKLFPWRTQIEFSKLLGQLQWFTDNPSHFVIIAYFNKARQGKVLAKRMTSKSIVCQYASEIRMICEKHAEHVPCFSFVPVCTFEDLCARIDGRQFVCVCLDANASVERQRKQIVNNLSNVREE
jgi:hypothetical protein